MSEIHYEARGFQNQYKQTQWYQTKDGFLYLNDSSALWYYEFNIKF